MKKFDVVIIGAGVTGCAIARELSKKCRTIAVLEKNADICEGTSKANSGIVHAGHDAKEGTLKARLNVRGNEMMEQLSKELDFPFKRNGSLVLCFDVADLPKLNELKERGEHNGVKGLKLLSTKEALEMEPNLNPEIAGALYAPMGGIVCPFGMNYAFAENAAENGVKFYRKSPVKAIKRTENGYEVSTDNEIFESKTVINAAGIFGDEIHNMVSAQKLKIAPRRGEYNLLDKKCGNTVEKTIFQLPGRMGKGILVTPTVHGNLLMGPTANDIMDKDDVATTAQGMAYVTQMAKKSVPNADTRNVITSFSGLRAYMPEGNGDFVINEVEDAPGFFDCIGIESPGLSAAPAIGEYVAELVNKYAPASDNKAFIARRKGIPNMALASDEERERLIKENPAYANVICRCEFVTEGEILDAIHRPVGAKTLDGIKRRTRAGMGRCQSGFCSPKVVEILARELSLDQSEIVKNTDASNILTGYTKEEGGAAK